MNRLIVTPGLPPPAQLIDRIHTSEAAWQLTHFANTYINVYETFSSCNTVSGVRLYCCSTQIKAEARKKRKCILFFLKLFVFAGIFITRNRVSVTVCSMAGGKMSIC